MKHFFKAGDGDLEHRANLHSQAAARQSFMQGTRSGSPRDSVAFSALAAATWLRRKLGGLVPWISIVRRKHDTEPTVPSLS
jgi:hypothetical protein